MRYVVKKQENVLGACVLYDVNRNPVKCFPKEQGDVWVFETELSRAVFYTQFLVKGFGGTMIFADNGGEGYPPSDTPLDLRRACIKSRLCSVERYAAMAKKEWGYLPKRTTERLTAVRRFLKTTGEDYKREGAGGFSAAKAGDAGRASSVSRDTEADAGVGPGAQSSAAAEEAAFADLLWAGEELVLFHANHTIERRGKRDHFTFGCCLKGFTDGGEPFRENFKELFGQGTIPTHWGVFEPYRGETHYDVMFDMLDWCTENGIAVRGHALVWFCPWWEHENWMGTLSYEEIRRLEIERAELIFGARPNAFECIDFNEPLQQNPYNFTMEEHFQIVKDVYDVVKRLSPKTRIMINFYDEWQNKYGMDVNRNEDFIAFKKQYKLPLSPPNEYCCSIPEFIDYCMEHGMQIDALGLQFHDFPYELFNTMELLTWWHERYHLPIQLTEICTPSAMGKSPIRMGLRPSPANPNYWHAPWDPQIQAQWYRDFATLFYSLDYVEVMNVWSYSDAPTQWADYLEGHINEKFKLGAFAFDGMMDFDDRPKPMYYQLKELKEKCEL